MKNVSIPLKATDVPIRANIYVPLASSAQPAAQQQRYPVLVTYGPYGKDIPYASFHPGSFAEVNPEHRSKYSAWETPDPVFWCREGYVVVRADERGTGQSPGLLDTMSRGTSECFFDVVEWAAEQPWSSGKVGLLGISYYAGARAPRFPTRRRASRRPHAHPPCPLRLAMARRRPPPQGPRRHRPVGGHVGLLPRPVPARRHPVGQLHRVVVGPPGACDAVRPRGAVGARVPARRAGRARPGGHDRGRPAGRGPGGEPARPDAGQRGAPVPRRGLLREQGVRARGHRGARPQRREPRRHPAAPARQRAGLPARRLATQVPPLHHGPARPALLLPRGGRGAEELPGRLPQGRRRGHGRVERAREGEARDRGAAAGQRRLQRRREGEGLRAARGGRLADRADRVHALPPGGRHGARPGPAHAGRAAPGLVPRAGKPGQA